MGCDIHGWVEVRPYKNVAPEDWESVVNISNIIGRNYDMFGLLFGVRNYCNYEPIADSRGMPKYGKHQKKEDDEDDRPYTLKESDSWNGDAHSHTFITWSEIEKIDWDKESDDLDERIHLYMKGKDGKEKEWGKEGMFGELTDDEKKTLSNKLELVKGNKIFRLEKTKLKDAISGDWKVLFDIMKRLAKQHESGDDVRLVVWFDN